MKLFSLPNLLSIPFWIHIYPFISITFLVHTLFFSSFLIGMTIDYESPQFWDWCKIACKTYINGKDILKEDQKLFLLLHQAPRTPSFYKEISKLLLYCTDNDYFYSAKLLVNYGANVNIYDQNKETPLHKALDHCYSDIIDLLISCDADVNSKNSNREAPLHLACALPLRNNYVKQLIIAGAYINPKNCWSKTPLHIVCDRGKFTQAKYLIKRGANIHALDSEEETPLHKACITGHADIIELLISQGARVNVKNKINFTPLHLASESGKTEAIKKLIAHGALVNCIDPVWQESPLSLACGRQQDTLAVKTLILNGAAINVKNYLGFTPLHRAAKHGNSEIVHILLDYGALINAQDNEGDTPLHLAYKKNQDGTTINMLIQYGADTTVRNNQNATAMHLTNQCLKSYFASCMNNQSHPPLSLSRENPLQTFGPRQVITPPVPSESRVENEESLTEETVSRQMVNIPTNNSLRSRKGICRCILQ